MSFTALRDHPDQTRHEDWDTRPSKAMSSIESVSDEVVERGLHEKVLPMVCHNTSPPCYNHKEKTTTKEGYKIAC